MRSKCVLSIAVATAFSFVLALSLATLVEAASTYTLINVGARIGPPGTQTYGYAINDAGQIAGQMTIPGGGKHAMLWSERDGALDLGKPDDTVASYAMAVSANGFVAGSTTNGPSRPFLWTAIDGMRAVPMLPGTGIAEATGVNSHGQVVGWYYPFGSDSRRAFLWSVGSPTSQDLGTLNGATDAQAFAINDLGQVVGQSGGYAFLWEPNAGMQKLVPGQSSSYAIGINRVGQVVGKSGNHVFVWSRPTGMIDLGPVPHAYPANGYGYPVGISNAGHIAAMSWNNGQGHTMLWTSEGGWVDLGGIGLSGVNVQVTGVNRWGAVVGWRSANTYENQIVLWKPM